MLNLSLSRSRLSHSTTRSANTSSTTSSLSRFSILPSFHRSPEPDLERQSSDSLQYTLASTSNTYAEDMDDDNIAWGPVSRKKKSS